MLSSWSWLRSNGAQLPCHRTHSGNRHCHNAILQLSWLLESASLQSYYATNIYLTWKIKTQSVSKQDARTSTVPNGYTFLVKFITNKRSFDIRLGRKSWASKTVAALLSYSFASYTKCRSIHHLLFQNREKRVGSPPSLLLVQFVYLGLTFIATESMLLLGSHGILWSCRVTIMVSGIVRFYDICWNWWPMR